ncbi:hypothetical protein CTAYLR_004828 [Chrysophaeum taylorii]|uniref:ubiquitinyl hydrolase 1 n=1 Tax=Chrysophaeum taylorii TaxID=2483200 RepID=A0AAD7UPF5_9STRA|nr:hypothetical protein CTAYLR_004828 [Chrysophaeum taylorii]
MRIKPNEDLLADNVILVLELPRHVDNKARWCNWLANGINSGGVLWVRVINVTVIPHDVVRFAILDVFHRGNDARAVVARQGAHGISNDCGLCALKNVTVNTTITVQETLETARELQQVLDSEVLTSGMHSEVDHFDNTGNFSGKVLVELAFKHGYRLYRISSENDGQCGHARALVETLSFLANSRLCGALWRLGSAIGTAAASGHWVAASHVPSLADWRQHEWAFKDSLVSGPAKITITEDVLAKLDSAERQRAEFFVVVDFS